MPKFSFKGIVVPMLSLFVICLVIAGALAAVNHVTSAPIAANESKAADEARKSIFPAADTFRDDGGYFTAFAEDAAKLGYCIETAAQGYGGPIKIVVGLDEQGKIVKVEVISCDDETPGLGMKIKEESFLSQFIGGEQAVTADSIASATYSSVGVENAVNQALLLYAEKIAGGEAG